MTKVITVKYEGNNIGSYRMFDDAFADCGAHSFSRASVQYHGASLLPEKIRLDALCASIFTDTADGGTYKYICTFNRRGGKYNYEVVDRMTELSKEHPEAIKVHLVLVSGNYAEGSEHNVCVIEINREFNIEMLTYLPKEKKERDKYTYGENRQIKLFRGVG